MSIIAAKDGMDVSFLLCTSLHESAPTESLAGLVIDTSLKTLPIILFFSANPTGSDILTEEIQKAREKREKCNESRKDLKLQESLSK